MLTEVTFVTRSGWHEHGPFSDDQLHPPKKIDIILHVLIPVTSQWVFGEVGYGPGSISHAPTHNEGPGSALVKLVGFVIDIYFYIIIYICVFLLILHTCRKPMASCLTQTWAISTLEPHQNTAQMNFTTSPVLPSVELLNFHKWIRHGVSVPAVCWSYFRSFWDL